MTTAAYKSQSNGGVEKAVEAFKSDQKTKTHPWTPSSSVDICCFAEALGIHKLLIEEEMKTHFDRLKPRLLDEVKS